MSTPDSSISAAESSMDPPSKHKKTLANTGESADESGDGEVWDAFNQSFQQVQTVLDRNRSLIQQVNENHQSRIPDNMVKNVALIQEINGNISKVVSLYSDLSSNFSTLFHQRTAKSGSEDKISSPQAWNSVILPQSSVIPISFMLINWLGTEIKYWYVCLIKRLFQFNTLVGKNLLGINLFHFLFAVLLLCTKVCSV